MSQDKQKSYLRCTEIALLVLPEDCSRLFSSAAPSQAWSRSAETRIPHPPRTAASTAAPSTAASSTTTTTPATSAATGFRRRRRCGYGKSGHGNSLEEVHSHHRDRRQDVRQGFQAYSTRHVSCHHQSLLANNASLDQHTPARQTHVSYRLDHPRLRRQIAQLAA